MNPTLILHALMQSHGLAARAHGDWLSVDGHAAVTRATAHRDPSWHPHLVQVDMEVVTADGRRLIESVTGIGNDGPEAAIKNGMLTLAMSSLDVLLRTFWNADCPELEEDVWHTPDGPRRVICGPMNLRGELDASALPHLYPLIEEAVSTRADTDLHWMRIFHCCGPTPRTEVLFDNEDWPELRARLAALPWPQTEHYASARLFLTIQAVP